MVADTDRLRLQAAISICLPFLFYCIQFTANPPSSITAVKGYGVWLQWQYNTFGINHDSYECFFDSGKGKVKIVEERGGRLTPVGAYTKRITIFKSNSTFSIWGLKYSDSGAYFCSLRYKIKVPFLGERIAPAVKSKITTITVEGPPVFCDKLPPNEIRVKEGGNLEIPVTFCGFPPSKGEFSWLLTKGPANKINLKSVAGDRRKQTGMVIRKAITRKRCGYTLAISGWNRRGGTEKRVKINVLFKPVKPRGIVARYSGSKKCVQVKRGRQESGRCTIDITVNFLSSNGTLLDTQPGTRYETTSCAKGIKNVQVKAASSLGWETEMVSVTTPVTTQMPTIPSRRDKQHYTTKYMSTSTGVFGGRTKKRKSSKNIPMYAGLGVGFFCLIIVIIVAVIYCRRKFSCSKKPNKEVKVAYDDDEKYVYIDQNFLAETRKSIDNLAVNENDEKFVQKNPYGHTPGLPERPGLPPPLPKRNPDMEYTEGPQSPEYLASEDDKYLTVIGDKTPSESRENDDELYLPPKAESEGDAQRDEPLASDNDTKTVNTRYSVPNGSPSTPRSLVRYKSVPAKDSSQHYQPLKVDNRRDDSDDDRYEVKKSPSDDNETPYLAVVS